MDDPPDFTHAHLTVSRGSEANRLGGQLLARAYQQLFPQVRRPLCGPRDQPSPGVGRGGVVSIRTLQSPRSRQECKHVAM